MKDRSSIIGFALIGLILLGFSWYNSRQYDKNIRSQSSSALSAIQQESVQSTSADASSDSVSFQDNIYSDSLVNLSSLRQATLHTISNDKLEVTFTTKGAQMHQVLIKPYYMYDSSALNIIRPGKSNYNVSFFTNQNLRTDDLVFDVESKTDTSLVMRLYFANGGYLEQSYWLEPESFIVRNNLAFVNMDEIMPRNISSIDIDWQMDMPRIEKGYKNERQYSRLDYMYPGADGIEKTGQGKDIESERISTRLSWFAFQQHFFSVIMCADKEFSNGDLSLVFRNENDADRTLMRASAKMASDFENAPRVDLPFSFYFGPNHYQILKASGDNYEDIVQIGGWLTSKINKWAIIPFFNWLNKYISNYGIIILIMTVLIKLIISPLTIKSYKSSAKMAVIKPEIDKLNEKYPKQEDALKKQQAMMDLYNRAGISPMGGCLPMLLQFPILFALFRFFPTSFELRQQSFLWADDLSSYDSIWNFGFNIPLFGDHLSLFALLMAVSMFLYSKMTQQTSAGMPGLKFMTVWLMPIMMLFICNNFSSGLSYYYMLSNIFTIGQTWVIKKYFVDEKKIMAQIQSRSAQPAKKSKFMQRLEEAQKAQQKAIREQAKKNARR